MAPLRAPHGTLVDRTVGVVVRLAVGAVLVVSFAACGGASHLAPVGPPPEYETPDGPVPVTAASNTTSSSSAAAPSPSPTPTPPAAP